MRNQVRRFADAMEKELAANDHKGGWTDADPWWLLNRLRQEVDELEECLRSGGPTLSEAADVANFALMIADVCGELP